MTKTLIRGACWFAIFGGCVMFVALIGTWTGVITERTHCRFFEARWHYDDLKDVPKIIAMALAWLILGCLGVRFIPKNRNQWVKPIWPDPE